MKNLRNFVREEDGMETVEMVLIMVVLIAMVAIFRDGMKNVLSSILNKIKTNANNI